MGYFVKFSEDQKAYTSQTYDRISFRKYLIGIGIDIGIHYTNYTYELEEKYKDEFAIWFALRRMEVRWWDIS